MFFKIITLYTLANISSLLFIMYFFTGFKITDGEAGLFLGIAIALALINYFLDPAIKFFTLKIKFPTVWLFASLIFAPVLYFATAFIPGISIKSGVFRAINFGVFQINSFQMSDILTVLVAAVIFGFTAAAIRWLME